MTQKIKLFERIKNNPKDVNFKDLENFLKEIGFEFKRTSGSHHIYSKDEITFVIPSHNNKVKEIYVKRVISLIENYRK